MSELVDRGAPWHVQPRSVLALTLTIDGLLLALHFVSQWLAFNGEQVFGISFAGHRLLDANREVSIPTWWQQLLLASVALLAWFLGQLARGERSGQWRGWKLLAALFLALSIDEGSEIHEYMTEPVRGALGIGGGLLWYAWVLPGMAVVVVVALVLHRFWRSLPSLERRLLSSAAAVYLTGAVGVEMLGGSRENQVGKDFGYASLAGLEEGLEMLGVSVFLYALVRTLDHAIGPEGLRLHVGASAS